ncbi:MAG TPA: hypothetical protein VFN10_08275 [Thermoanaerobaculia bacterium]|nr:hypothetical protein [Thermoanaerobaculia bacterium]
MAIAIADDEELEPPTEPLETVLARQKTLANAVPLPEPPPARPSGVFTKTRYRFTSGVRAGEVVRVRDDEGNVVLTYRSFASVVGIIAALVSGIVFIAGLAATLFLVAEGAPLRGLIVLALTIAFAAGIAVLVPRTNVTIYDAAGHPSLTIDQRSAFPTAAYVVGTPEASELAILRRSFFARLGRNRWRITNEIDALDESFVHSVLRKLVGTFSRRFEANVMLRRHTYPIGTIHRRGALKDTLELTPDAMDSRVAVALATIIIGSEP